jgi:hypothetical protein
MMMKIEESGKQEGLEGSGFRVQGSGFRVQGSETALGGWISTPR